MTVFTMFFIELMAARFEIFGQQSQDLEASDPAQDLTRQNEKYNDTQIILQNGKPRSFIVLLVYVGWEVLSLFFETPHVIF
jgi:zinc transporter 1/2/3